MKIKNALLMAVGLLCLCTSLTAFDRKPTERDIYEIKVYCMRTNHQVAQVDNFLKNAYQLALHRLGVSRVGVFKNVGIDTAVQKSIYVLIPLHSLKQINRIEGGLTADAAYHKDGDAYLNAPFDAPAYSRIEPTLLHAFNKMPHFQSPSLKGDPAERIYELSSYEGSSEKFYKQKVHMFNEGSEITLF